MIITNPTLGTMYLLFQKESLVHSHTHTSLPMVKATLIGIDPKDEVSRFLFGWEKADDSTIFDNYGIIYTPGKPLYTSSANRSYVLYARSHADNRQAWRSTNFHPNFEKYMAFIWAPHDCEVVAYRDSIITHTAVCVCMRCNAANPWAVSNRPDNKYICFECR